MESVAELYLNYIAEKLGIYSDDDSIGSIQFVIADLGESVWHLAPQDKMYLVFKKLHLSPTLELKTDLQTLSSIARGEFDYRNPHDLKRVKLKGNIRALKILVSSTRANCAYWMNIYTEAEKISKQYPVDSVTKHSVHSVDLIPECIRKSKPVILTDLLKNWKPRLWDFAFLRERFGDVVLNSKNNQNIFLDECIQMILDGTYLGTGGMILPEEMRGDIGLSVDSKGLLLGTPSVFLGAAGAITPLHRDAGNGLNAHIIGRKLWTLFSADQSEMLYPRRSDSVLGFQECEVNLAIPNYERYPLLQAARPLTVTIEPGEVLLIPSGWYHEVKLLDASLSIAFPVFTTD